MCVLTNDGTTELEGRDVMDIGVCRELEGMMGCSDGTPAWNTYQKDGCAHQL